MGNGWGDDSVLMMHASTGSSREVSRNFKTVLFCSSFLPSLSKVKKN